MDNLDRKHLTTKLVNFMIREHQFKKDVLYKNMLHISNLIINESTAQSLTPTINSILDTSLKNDQIILKLIEVLKKYGSKEIDDDINEEEKETDNTSELIALIEQSSDEQRELTEHLDRKVKESEKYNEEAIEQQEQLDKIDKLSNEK